MLFNEFARAFPVAGHLPVIHLLGVDPPDNLDEQRARTFIRMLQTTAICRHWFAAADVTNGYQFERKLLGLLPADQRPDELPRLFHRMSRGESLIHRHLAERSRSTWPWIKAALDLDPGSESLLDDWLWKVLDCSALSNLERLELAARAGIEWSDVETLFISVAGSSELGSKRLLVYNTNRRSVAGMRMALLNLRRSENSGSLAEYYLQLLDIWDRLHADELDQNLSAVAAGLARYMRCVFAQVHVSTAPSGNELKQLEHLIEIRGRHCRTREVREWPEPRLVWPGQAAGQRLG